MENIVNSAGILNYDTAEGIMPDFTNCERDDFGNYYTLDRESGEIRVFRLEKVKIGTIPQEIIVKLYKKEIERVKGENNDC